MSGGRSSATLGTAFVDRSGVTSGSINTFTPSTAVVNTNRRYLRVTNLHASAKLYVYDKAAGAPTTSNSLLLGPGANFQWIDMPTCAIQVASDTASVPYEMCEG